MNLVDLEALREAQDLIHRRAQERAHGPGCLGVGGCPKCIELRLAEQLGDIADRAEREELAK